MEAKNNVPGVPKHNLVSEEYETTKHGESGIGKENSLMSKGTAHETWLQRLKWRNSKVLEIVLLSCVILAVWSMFAIPTKFFALSSMETKKPNRELTAANSTGTLVLECSQRMRYEGQICSDELTQWQQCFSGPQVNDIHLPSNVDQQEAESSASALLRGLPPLSLSPECMATIRPFMCLYLFGSCDTNNQLRQVSQIECVRLRDKVCPELWEMANRILGEGVLPNCDILVDQEIQCLDNETVISDQHKNDSFTAVPSPWNITCAEGFYLSNNSMCQPLCSSWVDPPGIDPNSIAVIASVVSTLLTTAILIILALTLQREELLTFPKYYLIYLSITMAVLSLIILIGVSNREKFYCSSSDFLKSFLAETAFCTLSGISYSYAVFQIGWWTLSYTLGVCWGIFFPFHYENFKSARRFKYIHVITVILGVGLPIIPCLVQLKDGYYIAESPIFICFGRNVTTGFYVLVLPLYILGAIIITLLILIFRKILKEFANKRSSKGGKVRKAEAKILFIICYCIITGSVIFVAYTYILVTAEKNVQAMEDYFLCQSVGLQPGKQCGESPRMRSKVLNLLYTMMIVLHGLTPAVLLGFAISCTCTNRRVSSAA